jgi:hypothetical protein
MAIAVVGNAVVSSYNNTSSTATVATSPAFTPGAHSLMVAVCVCSAGSGTHTPSSVQTTSATNRYTFARATTAVYTNEISIWVADSGATPPNDTITTVFTNTITGASVAVFEITGADMTGTALQAIVTEASTTTSTSTTPSITYAAASNSDNRPLVAIFNNTGPATERSNWTELYDGGYSTPTTGVQVQIRLDAFETTGSSTITSGLWQCVGVEIKAPLTGSPVGFIPI